MSTSCRRLLWILVAVSLTGVGWSGSASGAPITYHVGVDTSSLQGMTGSLDFQFNPGPGGSQAATATITAFTSLGGTIGPVLFRDGEAAGELPGPIVINNSAAFASNEVQQEFTYSSFLAFDVTFSGDALDNPGGSFDPSTFAFFALPLPSSDPSGATLTITVNPDGTTTPAVFSPGVTVQQVPEPATLFPLAGGLLVLVAGRRTRPRAVTETVRPMTPITSPTSSSS